MAEILGQPDLVATSAEAAGLGLADAMNENDALALYLAPGLVEHLTSGFIAVQASTEGREALRGLYNVEGLARIGDADYDVIRWAANVLGLDVGSLQ